MHRLALTPLIALAMIVATTVAAQETASDYYEDARRYQDEGDSKAALIQLKNALSKDDQHVPSLLLSGDIYLATGDAPAAEFAYGEALLLGADDAYTTPRIAQSYLLQTKYRKILEKLHTDRLSGNSKAELLGYRALAHLELGEKVAAAESIEQALAINPEARVAGIARAQVLLQDNRPGEAKAVTEMLVRRYPDDARCWNIHAATLNVLGLEDEVIAAYSRAVAADPNLTSARLARAALLASAGQLEEAAVDVDFVRANRPGDPGGAYMKAQLLEQAGENELALDQYRQCAEMLSLAPPEYLAGNAQMTLMAAISHVKIGETQRASSFLQGYQSHDRNNRQTGQLLAGLLLEDGEAAAALKVISPLVSMTPDDPELLQLKARTLDELGRHRQAIAIWKRLLELAPDNIDTQAQIARSRILAGDSRSGIAGLEGVLQHDATRVSDTYLLATTYLGQGVYPRAVALGEQLVLLAPDNPEFRKLLGRSLMYAGELEHAHETLLAAAAEHPDFLPLLVSLAEVETLQGELPQARQRLLELSERFPQYGEIMLQRARVERLAGSPELARKWAENAALSNSSWLEPRIFLVHLLLEMGEKAAAEQLARETAARNAGNMEVKLQLARVLIAVGKSGEARSIYQLMAGRAQLDHELLYRIAERQTRIGAFKDASGTLFRATSIEPGSLRYRRAYIQVELKLENYTTALRLAEELGQDFPDRSQPHALRAAAYSGLGQGQKAVQQYAAARRIEPDNRDLLLEQYRALIALEETGQAERLLDAWLKQMPGDSLVKYAYTELLINTRRWPEAEAMLSKMVESEPGNPALLNNLAFVLQEMGRPEAVDVARRAQASAPHLAQINDTLGWILVRNAQPAEALPFLREAVARRSEDPMLRYHLAVALNDLGRRSEAARELTLALGQAGEFEGREDALALLQKIQ